MALRALLVLALMAAPAAARQGPPADRTTALVARLEQALAAGNIQAVISLGVEPNAAGLRQFASIASPAPTRLIIKERDRTPLTPSGQRLLLEVFAQYGVESTITTWRLDVTADDAPGGPRLLEMEQLTFVSGLYRLALNPAKQFTVHNLTVLGTDLSLEMPSGSAFVSETPDGPTAIVLLGRGRMRFAPADPAERTQVRIFAGDDALSTEFDALFVRVRPSEFAQIFPQDALIARTVVPGDLRRANEVFEDYIGQTLTLDLSDFSRERWSLTPSSGDLIAEVRTRRLGSLTYARSTKDAEDISLFERKRRRNIAVYASQQKLSARGRFYSEDQLTEYDVLRHDLDVSFAPDRLWLEGTARVRIKIRAAAVTSLTLRLAESLVVRSVVASEFGRLLHLRVVGQNAVIVNFPGSVTRDSELWLAIEYGGRLAPQDLDREGIAVEPQQPAAPEREQVFIPIEPQYLYSNRSYWYPQGTVTDYATAHLRITVPSDYWVVASGNPAGPPAPAPPDAAQHSRREFAFESDQPLRYLAFVISRFNQIGSRQIPVPSGSRRITAAADHTDTAQASDDARRASGPYAGQQGVMRSSFGVTLDVHANPRQTSRARALSDRAAAIFEYYGSILGDAPYPTFALAVTESDLPGGHSPAYFALLNQPLPLTPLVWRNDPVAFENYPPFFLAHEVAHQWWGQAVGWKNYHEQWLSEGFAQYFAALYAEHDRGDEMFSGMLRQMRRWAIEQSPQGPVYLGYRLGHIKGEGRVFRAVIYNKGAMVLHMLRRMLGDDAFFAGVRRFYNEWKFRKAGSDDLRVAMETASGRQLGDFFDAWIYGVAVPALKFTTAITGSEARVRLEHVRDVVPVPVTVSILYADGRTEDIVMTVAERSVERTLTLNGAVRSIEANRDNSAVAEIVR